MKEEKKKREEALKSLKEQFDKTREERKSREDRMLYFVERAWLDEDGEIQDFLYDKLDQMTEDWEDNNKKILNVFEGAMKMVYSKHSEGVHEDLIRRLKSIENHWS